MPITLAPIPDEAFDVLLKTFNAGYRGYIVQLKLEPDQMRSHIANQHIDLRASRIAYADGDPVGVTLLGVRGKTGWIGGVGVRPEYRGKGIGRRLMEGVLDAARGRGLETVFLEVIEGNKAAHELYRKLGFTETRRLLILECAMPAELPTSDAVVMRVKPAEALAHYDAFHEAANPWQRQPESLRPAFDKLSAWEARRDGETLAYALGYASEKGVQWVDLAAAAGEVEALGALVAGVQAEYPGAVARIVNLSADDPAWPLLSRLGYVEKMAQHEMEMAL